MREKIENNLTLYTLGLLVSGFIAGVATYEAIINIAKLEVITTQELQELQQDRKKIRVKYRKLQKKCGELENK